MKCRNCQKRMRPIARHEDASKRIVTTHRCLSAQCGRVTVTTREAAHQARRRHHKERTR